MISWWWLIVEACAFALFGAFCSSAVVGVIYIGNRRLALRRVMRFETGIRARRWYDPPSLTGHTGLYVYEVTFERGMRLSCARHSWLVVAMAQALWSVYR